VSEFVTRAEFDELKARIDTLQDQVNSLRQKPPMDIPRLVRVMKDQFGARPIVARR
jgi:hypothetical protein